MRYKSLGGTGLLVSEICLGTMTFGGAGFWTAIGQVDQATADNILARALDAGVNFVDTADVYSEGLSETLTGQAMRNSGRPRTDIVLATKATGATGKGPNDRGSSRGHIMDAVKASLKRLGTDYIDLYQLHAFDAVTPVEEALSTLDDLVRSGKIRYLGVSNFSGWHLMKSLAVADRYGWPRYVAHQAYYSLIGRDYEWELMPLAVDQGVGAVVWSPLGWGRLTGKIRRGAPLPDTSRLHSQRVLDAGPPVADEYVYRVVDALDEVAAETGKSIPQIAINWLLQRPTVANVIIGARNEEQLRHNLAAAGWNLTTEQVAKLDAASDVPSAYPYWHQSGFTGRNPTPASRRL